MFLTAGLAAFLLVLAVGRERKSLYIATARIEVTANQGGPPALPADALQTDLTMPDHVARSLAGIDPALSGKAGLSLQEAAQVVHVIEGPSGAGSASAKVFFTGLSEEFAVQFVNQLCELYVTDRGQRNEDRPNYRNDYEEARLAASEAKTRLQESESRWQAFQAAHAAELEQLNQWEQQNSAPQANPALAAAQNEVPQIEAQIEQQTAYLQQLLNRLTAEHPDVLKADQRINELRHQLAAARSRLASAKTQRETVQAVAVRRARRQELINEQAMLQTELEKRKQSYQRLSRVEREKWEEQFRRQRALRWTFDRAVDAERVFHPTALPLIGVAAALGLVIGGGASMATGKRQAVLLTNGQIEEALQVPVLGTFSEKERWRPPMDRKSLLARWGLIACELLVVAFLLGMFLAAIFNSDFAALLRVDPLAALSDGLWHMLQMTGLASG